jgi:putative endonuclease
MFFVYILKCCDGTLYTGYAADPANRLERHNRGLASKYTRSRLPVELVYLETLPDKKSAMRRESAIKKMRRRQKLNLINGGGSDDYYQRLSGR